MDKVKVFKELLDEFETDRFRKYCEDMINLIPDYIFTMPSSTTGKYHNATQCQVHGQIYHVIMFGTMMNYLLALKCNKEKFPDPNYRDAMRCVPIFHDAIKCGWDNPKFTVHEHPILAGKWVRETKVEHDIDNDWKDIIAKMCERHSGEWVSSKKSNVVLSEPETEAEILCHECDILSSRSNLDMNYSDYLQSVLIGNTDKTNVDKPNQFNTQTQEDTLDTYVLTFGKHSGEKLVDVWKRDRNYCDWMIKNITRQPVKRFLEELAKGK